MPIMTPAEVAAWKARWAAVEEMHQDDLRKMSLEEKLAATAQLFAPGPERVALKPDGWAELRRRHLERDPA